MLGRLARALAASLLLAAPAAAWNEPGGVDGVPWGASVEEARAVLERAGAPGRAFECRTRWGPCWIAGTVGPLETRLTFEFARNRLSHVTFSFDPSELDAVRAHFAQRYGPPTSSREREIEDRLGIARTDEIVVWRGDAVAIELRRYGGPSDQGSGLIGLRAVLDKLEADRAAAPRPSGGR